jgi:hypothetical protein
MRTVVFAITGALVVWFLSVTRTASFVELPGGLIASAVHVKLENESTTLRHYSISIREPDAKLRSPKPSSPSRCSGRSPEGIVLAQTMRLG